MYTINPAGSGVTNYVSFATAVTALNVAGVSGPVTFQVAAGTYTEQVNIGTIAGVSAANTITFDGLTAANAILTFAGTSTSNYWTVKLTNSPYVGFRNLTIRATGAANGVPVQISGTSHFARIKKCTLEITGPGATSTANNYTGILISNTATVTSPASGTLLNNLEIDSNTINGGYYGIYSYSNTSTPYSGLNKYRGNTILNVYSHGAYYYYNEAVTFSNNTITLRTTTANSYGVFLDNCQNTGTNIHTISGNNFTRVNTNGIYINGGGSTARNQINNNMVTGFNSASSYGLYIYNTSNYDIYHNTAFVDVSTSSNQYAALYVAYGSNIDVKNNIFVAHQAGSGLPVYSPSLPGGYFTMNYNNLYKYSGTASTGLFFNGSLGATYTSANLAGGGGLNQNSVSVNPGFVSLTNLHLSNACSGKGVNLAGITKDIDGDNRNPIPNMGADEATGLTNDVGIQEIKPFIAGTQDVKVVIRNFGGNTLTSVNVAYSVNGSIAKVTQWTGTLNPCDTVTVLFTGVNQYTFQSGVSYTVEAYTSLPNFTADPKTSNDTVVLGPTCVFLS
ncbi:MAG: right-handed parallel beta-helix repeat-containing protein, partial [Bacteroidota bacterium]